MIHFNFTTVMAPLTHWELLMDMLAVIMAYSIGSIPMGLLLGKWAGLGDIRQKGSGNIGATNLYRAGGKFIGVTTLTLDVLKTIIAILIGSYFSTQIVTRPMDPIYMAAAAAVIGHIFPVFLGGKGGKGIACFIGVLLVFHYKVAGIFAVAFLAIFLLKRMVSLASIVAILACIAYSLHRYPYDSHFLALLLVLTPLLIFAHRQNLQRLLRGTELQFSK
jgi:glycerol-3-phosphate acyltransferase PlsY